VDEDDLEELYDQDYIYLENLPHFAERGDGLPIGLYKVSGHQLEWWARYSDYGELRRKLCIAIHHVEPEVIWADYEAYEAHAFAPFIDFPDNHGFLGTRTCGRLAADAAVTSPQFPDGSYEQEAWGVWVAMFNLAAGTGVIEYS
jgi:hypothetical protein